MTLHLPAETFRPADPAGRDIALTSSRRQDGWSAANQRAFLEALAAGHGVDAACARVGLSVTSAYYFRRTPNGAAFALGWRAAALVAREALAETLLVRALDGQVDTVTRADGSTYTRHRHDNRLAASLLARLDRQVETAPDADVRAARLVAQDFDAFLGLVERDEGAARAGLFLAGRGQFRDQRDLAPLYALAAADRIVRTGCATAGDVDTADLDPRDRAGWTAEQWTRAEAAGLLALAPPPAATAPAPQNSQDWADPADDPDHPVWYDHDQAEWRTSFPPPADFAGEEDGRFGDAGYSRTLTDDEDAAMDRWHVADTTEARAAGDAARDLFFAGPDLATPPPPDVPPAPLAAEVCRAMAPTAESRVVPASPLYGVSTMTDTSHDIRTLNGLIATTLDSVDGYQAAAKDSDNGQYTQRFTARASERRQVVQMLQAEVARQGGNPEDDGTLLAGAHRVFLDLKSAVTGNDDKAIVNEVERGEDHIKAKYESALADTDLGPDTRSAIGAAWDSVKSGHDEMRDLKHSL